jgi:WhiB family redox-sensing transcriptional regulator
MSINGYPGEVPGATMPCKDYDPDIFFPTQEGVSAGSPIPSTEALLAIQVCKGCKVAQVCLWFAIENRERYGIWGGENTASRDHIARRSINPLRSGVI